MRTDKELALLTHIRYWRHVQDTREAYQDIRHSSTIKVDRLKRQLYVMDLNMKIAEAINS